MTDAPTTPSPERQPADAGGDFCSPETADRTHVPELERRAYNQMPKAGWRDLRLMRYDGTDLYQWFGKLGRDSSVRDWSVFEEACNEPFLIRRAPAPQAQPDARAWLVQEFNHDGVLRSEFAVVGDQPWSGERGADQITTQPLYLSAPAADDGWRPISDYDGCGPVLVSTAPESPKYLFSEPVSAFHDAGGTWRCLGSKGGMAETALRPTHFRPLPAPPVALHPAAPTDEVGKS